MRQILWSSPPSAPDPRISRVVEDANDPQVVGVTTKEDAVRESRKLAAFQPVDHGRCRIRKLSQLRQGCREIVIEGFAETCLLRLVPGDSIANILLSV
jgi:hypothetical protein